MKIQLGRASAGHTLLRYFLSYFLVAGILLLSFVLIAYNLLASAVSDRIYAQTEQRLEYVADRLEAELQSAFELNAALTGNIDVVLSRYDDSAYGQFMAGRRINDFAGINPFIDTAVFYDREDGRVFSSRRSPFLRGTRAWILTCKSTRTYGCNNWCMWTMERQPI